MVLKNLQIETFFFYYNSMYLSMNKAYEIMNKIGLRIMKRDDWQLPKYLYKYFNFENTQCKPI